MEGHKEDESTELTTMTSLESGVSSSDESGTAPLESARKRYPSQHRKTLLKSYLKSPQGKCTFSVVFTTLLILTAYVLSKLVIGLLFINSCQLEPFVPIYLVTSATLFIIFVIILIVVIIKCRRDEDDDRVSPAHLVAFLYFFIHLVIQLAGSVCVIRTFNLVPIHQSDDIKPDYFIPDEIIQDHIMPAGKSEPTASCKVFLLTYSFGVVVFELILSGLLFIVFVISLVEVIYLECCRATKHTKKPPSNE